MHSNSLKRVLIRQSAPGAALTEGFLRPELLPQAGDLEVLTAAGQTLPLDRNLVQAVYFVSTFDHAEAVVRGSYLGRNGPRLPGTWVRLRCRDRGMMEGILASDWLEMDAGLWLTPLYADSPCQRVYVPRSALESVQVVEVVRPVRRRQPQPRVPKRPSGQIGLFGDNTTEAR